MVYGLGYSFVEVVYTRISKRPGVRFRHTTETRQGNLKEECSVKKKSNGLAQTQSFSKLLPLWLS